MKVRLVTAGAGAEELTLTHSSGRSPSSWLASQSATVRRAPGRGEAPVWGRACPPARHVRTAWVSAASRIPGEGRRLRPSQRRRRSAAQAGRSYVQVTNEERERIREAARREQAPTPSVAVLERVARIVMQARSANRPGVVPDRTVGSPGRPEAA
jgi:hypothetical protein